MSVLKFKNFFAIKIALVLFVGALVWTFAEFSKDSEKKENKLIEFSLAKADSLVIFTGGNERIQAGLSLASKFKTKPKILITGVNPSLSEADLKDLAPSFGSLFDCCVEIGRQARSTCGNAREVSHWLADNKLKFTLLLTSDYHIARSSLEMQRNWQTGTIIPVASNYLIKTYNSSIYLWFSEFIKYSISKLTSGYIPCILGPSAEDRK